MQVLCACESVMIISIIALLLACEGKRYHLEIDQLLNQAAQLLPSDSAITFVNAEGIITYYRDTARLPFTFQIGMSVLDPIMGGTVTAQTWHQRRWTVQGIQTELLGFPYTVIAFPVYDDRVFFQGILSIVFPLDFNQEIEHLRNDNNIMQWLFRLSDVLLFLENPAELWPQFRDLFIQLMNLIGGCYFLFVDGEITHSECFGRIPISAFYMNMIQKDAQDYYIHQQKHGLPLYIEYEHQTFQLLRYNLSLERNSGEVVYLIQDTGLEDQNLMRFLLDYYRMAIQLINQRKKLRDQLDYDSLTGIWNRRALETHMENYFLDQSNKPAVFVLFDLDHFKLLNDTQGHQMGDEALQSIALYIRKVLRKGDWVARLGGDEFVLVLQNTKWSERWIWQMRNMLAKSPLREYSLGVTAGIVEIPREASTYQEAYRLADQRLYHGKKKEGNHVIYQPDQEEWIL